MPTLARSIFWLFFAEFAFYISGYLVQMGAGRILGPADYGRFGLVVTLTLLVANLIGNGVPIAMSKYLSEAATVKPELLASIKRRGALIQALFMGAVTVLFFLFAPGFSRLIGDPALAPFFTLSAFIIPCFAADAFYFYYYSGTKRFNIQSFLKISRAVMRITIILGLAYAFQLKGIIAGYIFVPLSVFLIALAIDIFSRKNTETKPVEASFPIRKIALLALPVTVFLVLSETFISFDIYLLKYFFHDDKLAGFYNAALNVARIPSYLFYALTLILLPVIAESSSTNDVKKMSGMVTLALRFMLLLSFPFIVFSTVYPETVIGLLFGHAFTSAASFLPLLSIGTSLIAIFYVLAFAYKGIDRIGIPLLFMGAGIFLNVLLDLSLFPLIRADAVPLAKALSGLVLLPFFLVSLRRTFQATVSLGSFSRMLLAAAILFLAARFFDDSLTSLLIIAPLLTAGYVAILFFLGEIKKEDFAVLRHSSR